MTVTQKHTIVASLTTVAVALIGSHEQAIRALASAHPTVTGVVVAIVTAVLGALPSSVGAQP